MRKPYQSPGSDEKLILLLLFLWLFPSCRVAGMTDDLSSPHRPVRLLARSQSSTFQISLTRVFPSCFRSSSLPFPWYICPQHFPQYVFAISPRHLPVPVQSSLGDLFGSLSSISRAVRPPPNPPCKKIGILKTFFDKCWG